MDPPQIRLGILFQLLYTLWEPCAFIEKGLTVQGILSIKFKHEVSCAEYFAFGCGIVGLPYVLRPVVCR